MRTHLLGLCLAGASSCVGLAAQQPIELAAGQVWLSRGVQGEPDVQFAVLHVGKLPVLGAAVFVRIGGMLPVPTPAAPAADEFRNATYPPSILRRHADELIVTLPADLLPKFDFDRWQPHAPELSVQTRAPSLCMRVANDWAREFAKLEQKLSAYLPSARSDLAVASGVDIVVKIVVSRQAEPRRVAYQVGATRCPDLAALCAAIRSRCEPQRAPRVVLQAATGVRYEDVAAASDAISSCGVDSIEFRAVEPVRPAAPEPRPGEAWRFRVPGDEKPQVLSILAETEVPGIGAIVFVRLDTFAAEWRGEPFRRAREQRAREYPWAEMPDPDALPWLRAALVRHLEQRVHADAPEAPELVGPWRTAFDRGLRGFLTRAPGSVVATERSLLESAAFESDLVLPAPERAEGRRR